MLRRNQLFMTALMAIVVLAGCSGGNGSQGDDQAETAPAVSGRVEAGLRVLTMDPEATGSRDFTIYRGDYVRVESTTGAPITISVPALSVDRTYPVAADEKVYFKVPEAGTFPYTANGLSGVLTAVDYVATGYSEVSAKEGAELIDNVDPFILDVRTPGEFSAGHLPEAELVPVQVLQNEVGNLEVAKERPIFVYCRSGNRSTVAAKILVDNGFTKVFNLRSGIKSWTAAGLPTTK